MILVKEKDERFYIKESTIKDAGYGVFASRNIKKGEFLEIIGVMVEKDSISDFCTHYAKDYKFAANFEEKFDKHIIPMGFGAIINHTSDSQKQNAELRYEKHSLKNPSGGSAIYYFIKDINKDEEILANYGWEYQVLSDEKYWKMFLELNLYNLSKLIN